MQMDHKINICLGHFNVRSSDEATIGVDFNALNSDGLGSKFQTCDALIFCGFDTWPKFDNAEAT
ncbi:hypothetical protein D3C78_1824430 [compost metagenome]